MDTELSNRKKKILQALVDSYINDVEPISSSAIKDKYLPEVSTATIRSELATLEEMGYLTQPHISSGRVPSSKAYRYYVDHFLEEGDVDMAQIKQAIESKYDSVKEIVKDSAKIISDVTNYTSMLMISSADNITVRDVKLVDMYDGTALVIIITDNGNIKDKEIKLPEDSGENYVEVANGLLSRAFAGKKLIEIINGKNIVNKELVEFRLIFEEVLKLIIDYKKTREDQLVIEGKDKIFNYPEYNDVENIKNFMTIVDHKEKLQEIMQDEGDIEFSVKIGKEDNEELEDMAIVSAKYKINGSEVGQIGVIGPQRMDYKKVVSVLKEIGKLMNNINNKK